MDGETGRGIKIEWMPGCQLSPVWMRHQGTHSYGELRVRVDAFPSA